MSGHIAVTTNMTLPLGSVEMVLILIFHTLLAYSSQVANIHMLSENKGVVWMGIETFSLYSSLTEEQTTQGKRESKRHLLFLGAHRMKKQTNKKNPRKLVTNSTTKEGFLYYYYYY